MTPFPTCVLVANRGEIVSRVARSARTLGVLTAAVYTESDRSSLYLDDADVAISLGADTSPSPYLDVERLLEAAVRAGADAVHPGYGFLAESAAFAQAVVEAGLTWIGPSAAAITAMGRKVEAKELAAQAGVPVLESVTASDDLAEAATRAALMPMPLLVKPSAGGGGKGMVVVRAEEDLLPALEQSRREALSSFGDGTLFVERYVEHPRHVEVQLLGDDTGRVLHLGERDCSIQRRHQKIIEESPAPSLPPELREAMCSAAVRLAEAIDYRNAGTVEFLLDGDEFFFLEMNTRLQVEHGVTEEVTGLDLVAWQLRLAAGQSLTMRQDDVVVTGHAVQARLYAEDPARDYLPSPGTVHRFEHPSLTGVRWEDGIRSGSSIGSRFDPMVSKVIAYGDDRLAAAGLLVSALRGLVIEGVHTNRSLLVGVLSDPEFQEGRVATDFLDRHPQLVAPVPETPADHAAAAVLYAIARGHDVGSVQAFAPVGWRNLRSQLHTTELTYDGQPLAVGQAPRRDGTWEVTVGELVRVAEIHRLEGDTLDLTLDGRRTRFRVAHHGNDVWVSTPDGRSSVFTRRVDEGTEGVRGAGAAVAHVPGVVVQVYVAPGTLVTAGDALAAIESMKMEHTVRAAGDGVVDEVRVRIGDSVESGQVLVTLEGEHDD
jgi:propionyl-CoA carboxylase alpha chain